MVNPFKNLIRRSVTRRDNRDDNQNVRSSRQHHAAEDRRNMAGSSRQHREEFSRRERERGSRHPQEDEVLHYRPRSSHRQREEVQRRNTSRRSSAHRVADDTKVRMVHSKTVQPNRRGGIRPERAPMGRSRSFHKSHGDVRETDGRRNERNHPIVRPKREQDNRNRDRWLEEAFPNRHRHLARSKSHGNLFGNSARRRTSLSAVDSLHVPVRPLSPSGMEKLRMEREERERSRRKDRRRSCSSDEIKPLRRRSSTQDAVDEQSIASIDLSTPGGNNSYWYLEKTRRKAVSRKITPRGGRVTTPFNLASDYQADKDCRNDGMSGKSTETLDSYRYRYPDYLSRNSPTLIRQRRVLQQHRRPKPEEPKKKKTFFK